MIEYSLITRRANGLSPRNVVFAMPQRRQVVSLEALCKHIAAHGGTLRAGDIYNAVCTVAQCVEEHVLMGDKVDLGPLGTFAPDLEVHGYEGTLAEFSAADISVVTPRWGKPKAWKNLRARATLQLTTHREEQKARVREVRRRLKDGKD